MERGLAGESEPAIVERLRGVGLELVVVERFGVEVRE